MHTELLIIHRFPTSNSNAEQVPQLKPQQPPPPDYYAGNLRMVLEHVQEFYADLLNAPEQDYIRRLLALDNDPQRLYARLLGRKGPWIRIDKLNYREVDDCPRALRDLERAGLIALNPAAPADALLGLLTQAERQALIPGLRRAPKSQWIAACVARYDDVRLRRRLAAACPWVMVTDFRLLRLCQLLFFGDDHQDMSTFVLQDLGLVRYEGYSLTTRDRLFADRAALERYQRLRQLSGLAHRIADLPELADWLVAELHQPTCNRQEQRQRDRTLNRLGQHHERTGNFDAALCCYGLSRLHPSRERQVRILRKLDDACGAASLVDAMHEAPRSAEELDFAQRFGAGRKPHTPEITALPLDAATWHDSIKVADPDQRIEAYAAGLLGRNGAEVFHLENSFPLTLAGLAFWDVIFEELPGAFSNPFQSGPLDLFWPDFAAARQTQLEQRTAQLARPGAFHEALTRTYREKQGVANRLVSWRHFNTRVLAAVLENMPADALLALASHVMRWPYRTRRGFPDLLVIYGAGNYEYVEVKGPTDQLQPAQRVWLKVLADLGQPARVLKFKTC